MSRYKSCYRKVSFLTEAEAELEAEKLTRQRGKTFRVYKCSYRTNRGWVHWHLTTKVNTYEH